MISYTENGGLIECHSLQEVLGEYRHKGFILAEEADDFLILYHEREEIGRYCQLNTFIGKDFLQKECRLHLMAHFMAQAKGGGK